MIKIQILSPEWSREVEAVAVFLSGTLGRFEILPGHAPIISTLTAGELRWRRCDGSEESIPVSGGVARLRNNMLEVCVEE